MEQTEQTFLLIFLFVLARIDMKKKELPLVLLGSCGAAGVIFSRCMVVLPPIDMVGGICIGGALLLCALVMKQGIGVGDGLLFCVTGMYLGLWRNLLLLFLSTLLCAAAGSTLMIRKKCTGKESLAFAPFVLAADVVMMAFMNGT